ncbi:MAG: hypothetical protein Q9217_000611 [Psora testacea]
MSTEVELVQTKPSCENCLAWSEDGELAIAAGENIIILVPSRGSFPQSLPKPWVQVRIKVNEFTDEEWPRRPLANFTEMSIGEEQSNSHASAVGWSPPGLAMHRRSVLAVLTANHLLSFWASESDPKEPTSWKRVLVVNNRLPDLPGLNIGPNQSRVRIRSMAWAPIDRKHSNEGNQLPGTWGPFLLAIALESTDVRILVASSPHTTRGRDWDVAQCGHFQCSAGGASPSPPSLLRQELENNRYIVSIDFRPLIVENSVIRTVLSCRYSESYTEVAFSTTESYPFRASFHVIEAHQGRSAPKLHYHRTKFTEQIVSLRKRHAISNGIKPHRMDVWVHGAASFGSVTALCVTPQPSNKIEYKSTSEEVTALLFHDYGAKHGDLRFPWQAAPAINNERAYSRIYGQLERTRLASATINVTGLKILYSSMIVAMILPEPNRKERLRQARRTAAFLGEELGFPTAFYKEDHALSYMESSDMSNMQELAEQVRTFAVSRLLELLEIPGISKVLDTCPIQSCGKAITWERVDESWCLAGHHLGGRCAITFLPILEPGQSKKCSDCYHDFIDERARPTFHPQLKVRGAPEVSTVDVNQNFLANHLLQSFDTCPFCGGKFYTF